jgi:hypothetical protein
VLVNEKRFGKEQIKVKIDRLAGDVPLAFFGDPIASSTGYAVCLYDEHNALRAALHVDRPGATCGTKPCWKAVGGPGYKYTDRSLVSDGVLQLFVKSGVGGKAKMILKAKNDLAHAITNLPTGVAAGFIGNRSATVQMMSNNAGCLTGNVNDVKDADGIVFKGTNP